MYFIFLVLWIVFNGKITLEILMFGLVIAAIMYAFICKFMEYSIKKDIFIAKKIVYILQYIVILVLEIIKANINVIHMITSSKYDIEPAIIAYKTRLKSKTARVILANSITLTPGTITVSLEEDALVIHCLDKDFGKGMEENIFEKLLEKLERTES